MADYHVGCGIAAIYAGILKKNGIEWQNKSSVTDEAIDAVRDYFVANIKDIGSYGYSWRRKDGKIVKLVATIEMEAQDDKA